jgi:PAS domain S-box-containing protein
MTTDDGDHFFAAVFAVSPVGIAIADQEGRYVDVNPTYCQMFGYSREELLGQTFGLILIPEQKPLEATILNMALTTDPGAPSEWQVQARDGSILTVRSSFRTERLPDGRIRIITALSDITALHDNVRRLRDSENRLQALNDHLESLVSSRTASLEESNAELLETIDALSSTRRALEESERANRLMIDTAHDAVITIDDSGLILSWNRAAESMFGWSAEEALGNSLADMIIPEGYREKHIAGLKHYQHGQASNVLNRTVEVFALHRYRSGFPVELSIWPHQIGGKQAFSAFIRDITDRKQAEQEVLEALERAQELAALKSRFVSMTSHEFRTPLTIIQSSMDLLRDCREHLSEADQTRLIDDVMRSIQRMNDMMDQVLVLGRTDERQASFKPAALDILNWCQQVIAELTRGSQGGQRIALQVTGNPDHRVVDERLLHQAVVNLLTNALKYSPAEMPVEMDLHFEPGSLHIEVTDHGIGIPEKDQDKLFQSFFRASNVGPVAGTGLGLSIVQKSIELHGGSLGFESKTGTGSRFWFNLPAVSSAGDSSTTAS